MKAKLLSHFCCCHCLRQVLLVGKDQKHGISHFVLVEHLSKFFTRILNTITVIAVNDVDEPIGALIVVAPQRTDLVLASCREVKNCTVLDAIILIGTISY